MIFLLGLALAQEVDPGVGEPPLGPPITDPYAVQEEVLRIGQRLQCPVCDGQAVAASNSGAALAMQERIGELVAEGYTDPQIEAYFVERYGEWILLEPDQQQNPLIWYGPPALLAVAGLGLAGWLVARRKQEQEASSAESAPAAASEDDPYVQKILRELEEGEA